MSIRKMLNALLNKPDQAPSEEDVCVLLADAAELEATIASRDKLMVLFYASWCPFSREFLKTCRTHAAAGAFHYVRILVDDGDPVAEKYAIEIFPTVLFFEKGKLAERLDGTYHRGLSLGQLEDFARRCGVR